MTALHTDILGTGEPIVFIHGSFATTSTWRKMVDTLARDHQCILFKLPGHGTAPAPDDYDAPTIDTELDRIDTAVRDITDRPVHLVGHSYGGMVALAMALRGTLPVRRLTLFEPVAVWVLDAAGDADMAARVTAFVDRYRQDAAAGVTHACGQVLDFWGGAGSFAPLPEEIKDAMARLTRDNLRHWALCASIATHLDDLRTLHCPTDLVCGTRSNDVAHAIVRHLHGALPDSTCHEIDGASHFMVTTHPEACLEILREPR